MIYWKEHDPRFLITFANPLGLGYDVWSWEGGQGWVDSIDLEEHLDFSEPFGQDQVSRAVRERLSFEDDSVSFPNAVRYPESLVLYCPAGEGISISLVGTDHPTFFTGLNTMPPDWWVAAEGEPPLQRMLGRVQLFIEGLSKADPRRTSRRSFQTKVSGYCSECGLLEEYHVSHDVPGFPRNVLSSFTTPQAARPYYKAFKEHYGGALKRMTEAEMLAMPLPPNKRYLGVLQIEIKRRLTEPPPVPASAIERLLSSDLLLE